MFSLFKRNKGKVTAAHRGWNQMGRWIDGRQRLWSNWLQSQSSKLTSWQLKLLLLLFSFIMAAWSGYILIQSF